MRRRAHRPASATPRLGGSSRQRCVAEHFRTHETTSSDCTSRPAISAAELATSRSPERTNAFRGWRARSSARPARPSTDRSNARRGRSLIRDEKGGLAAARTGAILTNGHHMRAKCRREPTKEGPRAFVSQQRFDFVRRMAELPKIVADDLLEPRLRPQCSPAVGSCHRAMPSRSRMQPPPHGLWPAGNASSPGQPSRRTTSHPGGFLASPGKSERIRSA